MKEQLQAKLLRIFTGEDHRIEHVPLYEKILREARDHGIAGGTVLKGMMSYGAGSHLHRARLVELSEDLPIVIEIVDEMSKIEKFIPVLNQLLDRCGRGGLATVEDVDIVYYKSTRE